MDAGRKAVEHRIAGADKLQAGSSSALSLAVSNFPHPNPYDIQVSFMSEMISCLDRRMKVGLFESPTGTGKSASFLCAALGWLCSGDNDVIVDEEEAERLSASQGAGEVPDMGGWGVDDDWVEGAAGASAVDGQPSWVADYTASKHSLARADFRKAFASRLAAAQRNHSGLLQIDGRNRIRRRFGAGSQPEPHADAEQEEVDEPDDASLLLAETDARVASLLDSAGDEAEEEAEQERLPEGARLQKIIVASRTHTQLAQLISELRLSGFTAATDMPLVAVALGSRNTLCANPQVRRLGSNARMDERCQEMRDAGGSKRCPFMRVEKDGQRKCVDRLLNEILDIEESRAMGERMHACPYYAAREASKLARVVFSPYQLVVSARARQVIGLDTESAVILFDEAHNLADTLCDMESIRITRKVATDAKWALKAYRKEFYARLKPNNRHWFTWAIDFTDRLIDYGQSLAPKAEAIQAIPEFCETSLKRVCSSAFNQFSFEEWAESTQMRRKVRGFAARKVDLSRRLLRGEQPAKRAKKEGEVVDEHKCRKTAARMPAAIYALHQFICSLQSQEDGFRILACRLADSETGWEVKFLLLNPAGSFGGVVEGARTTILAGGTLGPLSDMKLQLFPRLAEEFVHEFRCGHVAPRDSLLPMVLGRAEDVDLTITAQHRGRLAPYIARALCSIFESVPGGCVVFLPSYAFLREVMASMRSCRRGAPGSALLQADGPDYCLASSKAYRILVEPQGAGDLAKVLQRYRSAIDGTCGCAGLLSVVGGKLSEGINFADQLGRCVVMVGMPYANVASVELAQKRRFLDAAAPGAGDEYYQNICMRGVNQSIGRAIRHVSDYAAVVLMDARYARPATMERISGWVRKSMSEKRSMTTAAVVTRLRAFFAGRPLRSSSSSAK